MFVFTKYSERNVFAAVRSTTSREEVVPSRRIAEVYNVRSCTSLRKTNDPLGRETVSVRREALATKKRLLVPSLLPGRSTHSLDLHCHYDINEMPLKRCVCLVTRGHGVGDGKIDVKPT